ncbi:MAG: hypothetical protein D6702_07205 [Planctomycetota bacterium]|nr:MAG: hypothetical protein D6702_07205 [Planctomycetota bacterium]
MSVLLLALPAALLLPARAAAAQDPGRLDRIEQRLDDLAARVERLAAEIEERAAASRRTSPEERQAAWERHRALTEASPWADLRWQFLGPTNLSGRVTDVAVETPRGRSYAIYAATASGGVWKTVNEGVTWEPIFDQAPSTSIGDVTLAPSDQRIVWVGTGEANIFRSSMAGHGVYKSEDGGATWRHMGLAATHTIARIVVHPHHPEIVYVAASGNEWTKNEERGVYRSTDGGESWRKVLYVDAETGAIDLVMDPSNPAVLYAATWQRTRRKWNDPRNHEGSRGSSIYRSDDGGDTWREIVAGLPEARWRGRIGLDLCAARPEVVYAFLDCYQPVPEEGEKEDGEDSYGRPSSGRIEGAQLWRSDDRGEHWRKVSESNEFMRRLSATYGWVFGQVRVDPTDPDKVYLLGLALNVSEDGGRTFRRLRGMHGDHHALWIDPANPDYLVNGNDGGIVVSYDGGAHWRQFLDNLPAVQFYNVAFDMAEPFHVYGSIQDHGSRRAVVDLSRGRDRIRPQEWEDAPGGEASYHAVDPTDPDLVYSEGFYGSIGRSDLGSGERVRLRPRAAEGEEPLRGQWLAPFMISRHNPRIIYHGMNRLFRSLDRGDRFEPISPDLSWNDPARKGDIPYQTITTIDESPFHFGLLYAGTDDGRLWLTRDSGRGWTEISAGLAAHRWISRVVASAAAEGRVYVAQNGKRDEDFTPYLWRSEDFGATWTDIAAGIPTGPINVVHEDPKNPDVLYVGTDVGVYVSRDRGASWDSLSAGLPSTFVHDLKVHPRDDILVIATHGRGMWAMDVRPIQDPERYAPAPAPAPAAAAETDDDEEIEDPEGWG